MPDVPTLTLNNGVTLPAIGFGVFQTPPDETRSAVAAALSAGYRHIDTAAAYGNEREVGDAVRGSGLHRSDVFMETKIWISDYGYDKTLHGFEKSARKLGRSGSPRTSTCSTSSSPPRSSLRSTPLTPASGAAPSLSRSRWRTSGARSPRTKRSGGSSDNSSDEF